MNLKWDLILGFARNSHISNRQIRFTSGGRRAKLSWHCGAASRHPEIDDYEK